MSIAEIASQPALTTSAEVDVERERMRNRARMPEFARVVDELRLVFGPVKVVWARENGYTVGNPPTEE